MPTSPPGQPPQTPSNTRVSSEILCPERPARHLSNPNARKVTTLKVANQTAANESRLFTGGEVLPRATLLGAQNRFAPLAPGQVPPHCLQNVVSHALPPRPIVEHD